VTQPHSLPERREVHYAGHVQGVGFRYSTQSIARNFGVSGFVRNLSDGRVQLVVEGRKAELDGFLDRMADRLGHFIRSVNIHSAPASGEFVDFSIRF